MRRLCFLSAVMLAEVMYMVVIFAALIVFSPVLVLIVVATLFEDHMTVEQFKDRRLPYPEELPF